jgi:hypothetical protein
VAQLVDFADYRVGTVQLVGADRVSGARPSVTGHLAFHFAVRSVTILPLNYLHFSWRNSIRRFCPLSGADTSPVPISCVRVACAPTLLGIRMGLFLARMPKSKRIWRSATACVAAYTLVLYAILSNLSPLSVEALGATASGLEICLHADPAAPAGHSNADQHCKLCLPNGKLSNPPPTPPLSGVAYASKLRWVVIPDDFVFLPPSLSARPRGPPLSV